MLTSGFLHALFKPRWPLVKWSWHHCKSSIWRAFGTTSWMTVFFPVFVCIHEMLLSLRKYFPSCFWFLLAVGASLGEVSSFKYWKGLKLVIEFLHITHFICWSLGKHRLLRNGTDALWQCVCITMVFCWTVLGSKVVPTIPCRIKAHRANLPVGLRRHISHFNAWLIHLVKWLPSKYGLHFLISAIIGNAPRSVTEYFFSVS